MARGEPEDKSGRGAAVAIWAVFGVACLAVAWVVVDVSVEPTAPDDPFGMGEPHPGIEGPLRALTVRGCGLREGPRLGGGGEPGPQDVRAHLERRGYVEARAFGQPATLPATVHPEELQGACGVIAAVHERGGWLERAHSEGESITPCDPALVFPVCGTGEVVFEGQGSARIAVFVMPGILPNDALPADVQLAHAEAVALLGAAGWTPVPQAMRASQSAGTVATPPTHPSGGCVPYVVAGRGFGHATTNWMGRHLAGPSPADRFLAGMVVCDGGRSTTLTGTATAGMTPVLVARPFRMGGGPSVPTATTAVPLELLAPGDRLPMPPSLRDHGAP